MRDLALLSVLALGSCAGHAAATGDAGPADAGPELSQGSPAASDLVINEVSPAGKGAPDWIELLNRSDHPIDLCGYFLTDLTDRLDHYSDLGAAQPPAACSPRLLAAGARLVVYADDTVPPAIDHVAFHLSHADEVHLMATDGIEVDGLLYLYPRGGKGQTMARVPDGEGPFYLRPATKGAANPGGVP